MSAYQQKKQEVVCPKCLKTRLISVGQVQNAKRLNTGFVCRSCSRIGIKYEDTSNFGREKGCIPWNKDQKKLKDTLCKHCGKVFQQRSWQTKETCSYECSNRFRVANGTHSWFKGGVTPLNQVIRSSIKGQEWKQEVIQLNGFKCSECKVESLPGSFVLMHVDHIIPLSYLIRVHQIHTIEEARECDDLFDVSNGRVLCVPCHEKTDTFLYRARDYQLEEIFN